MNEVEEIEEIEEIEESVSTFGPGIDNFMVAWSQDVKYIYVLLLGRYILPHPFT